MHETPRGARLAALAATAALVFAACGSGTTATPTPTSAPATSVPTVAPTAAVEYKPMSYPETGTAPCGVAPYTGNLKKITALDAKTVEFQLCAPDVAFLSKIAFAAFGISDSDYLAAHAPDKSYLTQPNGTGPYKLKEWSKGNRVVMEAFDGYWGTKALSKFVEFRWSEEAAQRLLELQSGNVDGIDNPGTSDIATIKADSTLAFKERAGLNVLYLGMNVLTKPWDDVRVRQAVAMGINRQQIVDNFYPAGSEVATHFTPCAIPFGCEGEATWDFNVAEAKRLLTEAGYPNGFKTKITFRTAVRGYLPEPPVIATEIAQQLKANLGIDATIDVMESGALFAAQADGTLDGLVMLGWGADFPDATNFLDYHFGKGSGKIFGKPFDDIAAALAKGGAASADADRAAAYAEANNLIKEHVPAVIMVHGGSGTAWKADVTGAHSSPLGNEQFATMKAGDRDTLVWDQNLEPLSLYCGDESDGEALRACEQITESLYGYELGGTKPIPALATECKPNTELTTWTCALREGVKFHNGADFDANDVVVSFAAAWDTKHPLHIGRDGLFTYIPGNFGGFLNPPTP
jgi:peptide/nickel transport system substrate-binding protein